MQYSSVSARLRAVPPSPDDPKPPPVRRARAFNVRIDPELYDAAMDKAYRYGLAAAIRALLRRYVNGQVQLSDAELEREATPAPRRPRERRPPRRKPAK
jgi:hypothetical protein